MAEIDKGNEWMKGDCYVELHCVFPMMDAKRFLPIVIFDILW